MHREYKLAIEITTDAALVVMLGKKNLSGRFEVMLETIETLCHMPASLEENAGEKLDHQLLHYIDVLFATIRDKEVSGLIQQSHGTDKPGDYGKWFGPVGSPEWKKALEMASIIQANQCIKICSWIPNYGLEMCLPESRRLLMETVVKRWFASDDEAETDKLVDFIAFDTVHLNAGVVAEAMINVIRKKTEQGDPQKIRRALERIESISARDGTFDLCSGNREDLIKTLCYACIRNVSGIEALTIFKSGIPKRSEKVEMAV